MFYSLFVGPTNLSDVSADRENDKSVTMCLGSQDIECGQREIEWMKHGSMWAEERVCPR